MVKQVLFSILVSLCVTTGALARDCCSAGSCSMTSCSPSATSCCPSARTFVSVSPCHSCSSSHDSAKSFGLGVVEGLFSSGISEHRSSRHERKRRHDDEEELAEECSKLRKENRKLKEALENSEDEIESLESRMNKLEKKLSKLVD